MDTHRVETTLEQDGTITITGLPYHAGETVEVLIVPKHLERDQPAYRLRGTPVSYADPFEPVADGDWDATR
jgi:hypothetical protein